MAMDRLEQYPTPYACAKALGPKLGVGVETLRKWILQAQVDRGDRSGPTTAELEEIKRLKAEVRDLREANEILKAASIFSPGNSTLAPADLRFHRRTARRRAWGRVDLSGAAHAGPAGRPTLLPGRAHPPGLGWCSGRCGDLRPAAGPAHRRTSRPAGTGDPLRPAEDDRPAQPDDGRRGPPPRGPAHPSPA